MKMRRSDREVLDISRVYKFLLEEDVMRLAFADDEGLYIVPVNYGCTLDDETFDFYIHGADEGRKAAALKKAAKDGSEIAFEIDGHHEAFNSNSCNASYYYASVIGKAHVKLLEGEEKTAGLKHLMDGIMPAAEYVFNDNILEKMMVCRLTATEWSCKQHSR
ncbi:MAG: pyridoxamine 5'-phosphate oxidase family protein [Clostridiales bacterium]|nr:pyridoxamine 5'-phosphate oxidase family protein [Candidatus Crickella caballi]